MADHSALMRAATERDISHTRLGMAVAFIELKMDPDDAAEAISLIHAAISPGHAVQRERAAAAAAEVPAPAKAPRVRKTPTKAAAKKGPAKKTRSKK